ncbi:MAG: hypothetical protein ACR2K1_12460, partial [Saprospiraceae bacterium]
VQPMAHESLGPIYRHAAFVKASFIPDKIGFTAFIGDKSASNDSCATGWTWHYLNTARLRATIIRLCSDFFRS